mmetsp:Transcript_11005/g.39819  ORF Transcript_11005/g.39819 Transcript_11005/m.39819 type:complete len:204 (+) Transcript_11005:218-829(+)
MAVSDSAGRGAPRLRETRGALRVARIRGDVRAVREARDRAAVRRRGGRRVSVPADAAVRDAVARADDSDAPRRRLPAASAVRDQLLGPDHGRVGEQHAVDRVRAGRRRLRAGGDEAREFSAFQRARREALHAAQRHREDEGELRPSVRPGESVQAARRRRRAREGQGEDRRLQSEADGAGDAPARVTSGQPKPKPRQPYLVIQ